MLHRLSSAFRGLAVGVSLLALSTSAEAFDLEYRIGGLHIVKPWALESLAETSDSSAFLIVTNEGRQPDRLVHASAFVAGEVEFAENGQGLARARSVSGVTIAPGETIGFSPGGLHIELKQLREQLRPGDTFPMLLVFERAGEVRIDVLVAGGKGVRTASGGARSNGIGGFSVPGMGGGGGGGGGGYPPGGGGSPGGGSNPPGGGGEACR